MLSIVVVLTGLLLSGVWIGCSLALTGVFLLYFFGGGATALLSVVVAAWNTLYNFSLAALPIYIFLGEVFVFSGLASRSYDSLVPLLERFPGKLLLTNVVVAALFGAILGSSMACAAVVSAIAYQELSKRGYDKVRLAGNLAGAGTLGSFIPPSIGLIIYGSWVKVPVGSLFMAALVPALITTGLFLTYIVVLYTFRPEIAPPSSAARMSLGAAILYTKGIWPLIALILTIALTIYFGVATPTEAGGVAALLTVAISATMGTFSWKKLYQALMATSAVCGMLTFIIVGAVIFSISVSVIGLPRLVVAAISDSGLPPIGIIALIFVLYLIMGCFVDGISMLLMTLPFLFPVVTGIGYDPIWFGVAWTITGEMGLLTPPVGINLFILQGVSGLKLGEVARGGVPYLLMLGVTFILITVFPELCTWLPSRMH